jgi:hypothetical protein
MMSSIVIPSVMIILAILFQLLANTQYYCTMLTYKIKVKDKEKRLNDTVKQKLMWIIMSGQPEITK